jgi:predicted transcriptional regulator
MAEHQVSTLGTAVRFRSPASDMACHLPTLTLAVMKTAERIEARRLRREGISIKNIARRVGVSQSSVSIWVRDIELTPEQHQRLNERNRLHYRQVLAHAVLAERHRERRRAAQMEGRRQARAGDPFHAAGCMLYWAEGSKTRNAVKITNSDPEVLRFFVRFVRAYFDVTDEMFRVTCNLFADHVEIQGKVEQYWLDQLELPRASLRKSVVNVYSKYSQKKRSNRLPFGTCRVSVYRTAIVQHIFGAIQEYAGFDRPEWLDSLRSEAVVPAPTNRR